MRIRFLCLFFVITSALTPELSGQHHTVQDFRLHKRLPKSTDDTLFQIETGYSTTGILLKVDENEDFTGSFVIVKNDTLHFTEGEEGSVGDNKKFSNLLTFSVPIESFLFCPGRILGDIQFYYINAQRTDEGSAVKPSKKKRCRLFRARHD